MTRRYLFYITQNYSFEILRPLQQAILSRGDSVKWFAFGEEVNHQLFQDNEQRLTNIQSAIDFQPHACFVPGNDVPHFISGLKVQVFHGLEWKKKGHFVIRGFFDLYCTHGPATTSRFNQLAQKYQYFDVVETGWPKLDTLFSAQPLDYIPTDKPIILYAPTFSPSLTSAEALFPVIKRLVETKNWHWLFKFHPKMDSNWIKLYQQLTTYTNVTLLENVELAPVLQTADIMVSDTSSVIGEFALINKPCITLNNKVPGNYLINIHQAEQLEPNILKLIAEPNLLDESLKQYANELHPYTDGLSSQRVLDAVEQCLTNGKKANKPLPLNLFRRLKMRKKLNYWRW
jgi:hypothetical protein